MGFTSDPCNSVSIMLSSNTKVVAHEAVLQQSLISFKDVVADLKQIQIDSENYREQYISLKKTCENKTCSGAEELKKVVAIKDLIIQSVASLLTKLNETRNFGILAEAFKILCEESAPLTPPTDDKSCTTNKSLNKTNEPASIDYDDIVTNNVQDISVKEESMCEIEGTPTGRTSPILNTRKVKSSSKTTDYSDKKKCPDDWSTPKSKCIKLVFPSPSRKRGGKFTQTRLHLVKAKPSELVDLTSTDRLTTTDASVQPLIKESMENEDTILPSPTSGPTHSTVLKSISKASPSKFKKPLRLKVKTEKSPKQDENTAMTKHMADDNLNESINVLKQVPLRLRNNQEDAPIKMEPIDDEDMTNCEMSLLIQIDKLEAEHMKDNFSPAKRPLATNLNIMNTPPKDPESSISILRPEPALKPCLDRVKRQVPELVEPVYKEPTVRNKIEKRLLQGWSCEECQNFYGVLYKNDPAMLAKKINECSKHRGRHNPARPKTPPNFWNPRWHVPDDTEELNRLNNAS